MRTMTRQLKDRVDDFMRRELPGQPMMMHMGTYRLINDLWRKAQERDRLLTLAIKHCPKGHHDWQEILKFAEAQTEEI